MIYMHTCTLVVNRVTFIDRYCTMAQLYTGNLYNNYTIY